MTMVASVSRNPEDEIDNDTSFVINFRIETERCETESNSSFRKNGKTCLQNKKVLLRPPSRHGHFHPILN